MRVRIPAPTGSPRLLPGRCTVGCPLLQVCTLGWVKCREHISLLIILCIIVYVTNKAHPSLICICCCTLTIPTQEGESSNQDRWSAMYIPCTTSLHILLAHSCLYYYLCLKYTVLHILLHILFFHIFHTYFYVYSPVFMLHIIVLFMERT